MVFKKWVKQQYGQGGFKTVADFLGVSQSTVYAWSQLARFPSPHHQEVINTHAGNALNLDQWRREYLSQRNKSK